ncbi:MAG: hypothetical protein M1469_02060 [Bacteroidetes bacterium]|nr:hypothetical protein [Bacteroidota bacterium]
MASGISPLIPYWNQGAQWTYNQWNFYKYLPEDSAKGKYLVLWGVPPNGDYASMYNNYCFRRVVCTGDQIAAATSAGFRLDQLIISIGYHDDSGNYIIVSDWGQLISEYKDEVLGYLMDEPSGFLTGQQMADLKSYIVTFNGKLWLDDYDTGVIPSSYAPPHNYHLADVPMLNNADYVLNDGNTSIWISGNNPLGIGPYLSDDYNEFQGWFGTKFNAIVCKTMDNSGALRNDQTMWDWLQGHSNCNNFVLYLDWAKYSSGVEPSITNFEADAYDAGFLGTEKELYDYKFVCEEDGVTFTPNGTANDYYGVWNGNGYSGPVDPSTPGAVVCWQLASTTPTGQFQDTY